MKNKDEVKYPLECKGTDVGNRHTRVKVAKKCVQKQATTIHIHSLRTRGITSAQIVYDKNNIEGGKVGGRSVDIRGGIIGGNATYIVGSKVGQRSHRVPPIKSSNKKWASKSMQKKRRAVASYHKNKGDVYVTVDVNE